MSWTKSLLLLFSSLCSTSYLVYRSVYTLNLDGAWQTAFSILLLLAEIHGVGLMLLYFWQIQDTTPVRPMPPITNRTVDVFLPTYNEDVHLLRGSLASYLALDYPCQIHVLDDGNREEVKQLAQELGVNYIARGTNLHAKAGNINYALEMTSGEFVVIFDADHVARPHFISRTIGHFVDDRVGWVQTPHAFYNFDSFSSIYRPDKGKYWEEGDLFYRCIQLGKSNANAVVFCGSAAIMRRKALEDVGLIAVETITEDMHTGLRMHAKGWKSVFVEERLIAAQAAADVTTFQSQRLRWGQGNLSIIRHDNPLTIPGLTLTQRIHYTGSMLGWTSGIQRLVIYATPILMLLTGHAPVNAMSQSFLAMLCLHLIVSWTTLKLTGMGAFRILGNELSGMANFWIQCRCTWRALTQSSSSFVVTRKRGRQSSNLINCVMPQLIVLASGLVAVLWAVLRIVFSVDQNIPGFLIGTSLVLLQSAAAWVFIRRALCGTDRRFSYRHQQGAVHVSLHESNPETDSIAIHGVCCDLNETGIRVLCFDALECGASLRLTLHASSQSVVLDGVVKWKTPAAEQSGDSTKPGWYLGIYFHQPTNEELKSLWAICLEQIVAQNFDRFDSGQPDQSNVLVPIVLQDAEGTTLLQSVIRRIEGTLLDIEGADTLKEHASITFNIHSPLGVISGKGRKEFIEGRGTLIRATGFCGQGRGQLTTLNQLAGHSQTAANVKPMPRAQRRRLRTPLMTSVRWVSVTTLIGCVVFSSIFTDHIRLSGLLWLPASSESAMAYLSRTCDRVRQGDIRDLSRVTLLSRVLESRENAADFTDIARIASELQPDNEGLMRGATNAIAKTEGSADALSFAIERGLSPELCETDSLIMMVRLVATTGTPSECMIWLNELISRSDLPSADCIELAGHCLAAGQTSLAKEYLVNAEQTDDPAARGLMRVLAAVAEQDFDTVIRQSSELTSNYATDRDLMLKLADCLYWAARFEEATDIWSRLEKVDSLPSDSRDHYADALLQLGNPADAMQVCMLQTKPDSALQLSILLEAFDAASAVTSHMKPVGNKLRDTELQTFELKDKIDNTLDFAVNLPHADLRLLWAVTGHLRERDPALLLQYLETQKSKIKLDADLLLEMAQLYFQERQFETVLSLEPEISSAIVSSGNLETKTTQLNFLKARSLAEVGQHSEAAAILQRILAGRQQDTALTLEVAGLLLTGDEQEKALKLTQQISLKECSMEHAKLTVRIQSGCHAWGILEDALQTLHRRFPDEPEFRFAAAELAYATDDFKAGLEALQVLNTVELNDADATKAAMLTGCGLIWSGQCLEGLSLLMPLQSFVQGKDKLLVEDACLQAAIQLESIPHSIAAWGLPVARTLLKLPPTDARLSTACAFLIRNSAADEVVARLNTLSAMTPELTITLVDALAETEQDGDALKKIQELIAFLDADFEIPAIAVPVVTKTPGSWPEIARTTPADSRHKSQQTRQRLLLTAARCAANCGRVNESADYFERLYREGSLESEVLVEFAGILLQLEQATRAASLLPKTDELPSDSLLLAVDIQLAAGNITEASRLLSRCLDSSNTKTLMPAEIDKRRAQLAMAQQDFETAAEIFMALVFLDDENLEYTRQAAGCLLMSGQNERSVNEFRKILTAGRLTSEDAASLMTVICLSETVPNWASDWTRQVEIQFLQGTPLPSNVIEQLVYLRQKQEDPLSALQLLKRLVQTQYGDTDRLRFLLANIAAECGQYAESETQLNLIRQHSRRLDSKTYQQSNKETKPKKPMSQLRRATLD